MSVEYRNFLLPSDRNFAPEHARIAALVERLRAGRWVLTPDDPAFADIWTTPPTGSDFRSTGGWAAPFVEKSKSPRERIEKAVAIPIPVDAGWLAARRDPTSRIAQADELALHFQVNAPDESFADLDMPYPLAWGEDETGHHEILVYASRDFVLHPSCHVRCACGAELAYEIGPGTIAPIRLDWRVRAACGACGAPFDGNDDALEGEAFRFAVVVDCSDGWPMRRRAGLPDAAPLDASTVRSPYGDAAPPIAPAFLRLIEETIGARFDSLPEFY